MNEPDEAVVARLVLEEHPVATVLADLRGTVLYSNAEGRALFSDTHDPLESLSGWAGQRRSLPALLAAAASSSGWSPLRLVRGAREVHARARGLPAGFGEAPNVLIMASPDQTEPFVRHASQLQRLNDRLAQQLRSEKRTEFALEAAGIGIWEHEVRTGKTWRSARHDAIFGYERQVPGWNREVFLKHVLEDDRDRIRGLVERAITRHQRYRFQCRINRADGEVRWISAEGVPVIGPEGDVLRVIGVLSDITDAKEAEARIGLAERMESLGQMAGGLAHDFANIVGIVRLQAEVALLTRDTETVWSRLDSILQAAHRGGELAARTLAFARREPSVAEAVALRPLVAQVVELTFGEAIKTIGVDTAGVEEVAVHCDPGQLENALLNLTFNARDAIEASGVGDGITVTAQSLPGQAMVQIAFADNGPGMEQSVLERAADPFFTTKEGSGGTGLGLSSVAAFCASSGGTFDIRSAPGAGTTVTLTLPEAQLAQQPGVADPTDASTPGTRILKLLLVEDLAPFREAMELMLSTMGHEVTAFDRAAPALRALEQGLAVDILVTDILLPGGMNGFDLARAAAALRKDLGVVYTSGYAEVSDRKGAPAGPFLRKPVDRKDLMTALRQASESPPGA